VIEVIAGPITQPCVSSQTYEIAVVGVFVGLLGFCALVSATHWFTQLARQAREAKVGKALLDVCGGDVPTAETAIANMAVSNKEFDDAVRDNLRGNVHFERDYAQRRDEFNAACRDELNCGGPRWLDVQ
jgi:hypothetical protein